LYLPLALCWKTSPVLRLQLLPVRMNVRHLDVHEGTAMRGTIARHLIALRI
jgi:hypothetical protein